MGLTAGSPLLGPPCLVIKTKAELHGTARRWAWISGALTAALLFAVSLATLFIHPRVAARWGLEAGEIDWGRFISLAPIPLIGLLGLGVLLTGLKGHEHHHRPFIGALLLYLSGYLGLAAGFAPFVVPYALTYEQAAAADNALALMLAGTVFVLPLILGYTAWVYWIFRGKVGPDAGYH